MELAVQPIESLHHIYGIDFSGAKKMKTSESRVHSCQMKSKHQNFLAWRKSKGCTIDCKISLNLLFEEKEERGGVAGIQKLLGAKAFRKLERAEQGRVLEYAKNFVNSTGNPILL